MSENNTEKKNLCLPHEKAEDQHKQSDELENFYYQFTERQLQWFQIQVDRE